MANSFQQKDALDLWLRDYLRQVDTFKPAIVTAVKGNRLDARILTKTAYQDKQLEQPDVMDVPYMIYSANRGAAAITIPLKVNDLVMVAFSDRDVGDMFDATADRLDEISGRGDGQTLAFESDDVYTHRYNAVFAMPSWYTAPIETPVDPDNIVIRNQGTQVVITPEGQVNITADTVSMSGNLNVTGDITSGGDITADGDVEATNVVAEAEVTAGPNNVALTTHTHIGSPTAPVGPVSPTGIPVV